MRIKVLAAAFAAVLLSGCAIGGHGYAASNAAGAKIVSSLKQTGHGTTYAITYDRSSSGLPLASAPLLNQVAQYLQDNPAVHLEISSRAGNLGEGSSKLSQDRTNAIKAYLVAAGIAPSRLDAED